MSGAFWLTKYCGGEKINPWRTGQFVVVRLDLPTIYRQCIASEHRRRMPVASARVLATDGHSSLRQLN